MIQSLVLDVWQMPLCTRGVSFSRLAVGDLESAALLH